MPPFARRVPGLQAVFPSSSLEVAAPAEVSDFVSMVHLFLGPLVRMGERKIESIQGADATQTVDHSIVPQDTVRYIPFAALSHNDGAINHILEFNAREDNTALAVMIDPNVSSPANVRTATRRSILLPAGFRLRGSSFDAIPAGSRLLMGVVFVDIPVGELHPFL